MARLPSPNEARRPAPRFGGVVARVEADTTAEQGIMKAAQGIKHFGEAMHKAKTDSDNARVEASITELQQKRLDLYKNDKTGFIHKKSGDVVEDPDFYDNRMSEFDAISKEIADRLDNDDQRERFNLRSNVQKNGHQSDVMNHMIKEKDVYAVQAYQGGMASEAQIATISYDNPDKRAASLLRIEKLTEAEATRLGITGDAKEAMILNNRTKFHEALIAKSLDEGESGLAQELFDSAMKKNQISPDRQDDLRKALKTGNVRGASMEAVDGYMERGLTEDEANKQARKDFPAKTDADKREAALSRIKARYGEDRAIKERVQGEYKDQADTAYEAGIASGEMTPQESYDAIPPSVLRGMDQAERGALRRRAQSDSIGVKLKTDPDKWEEFEDRLAAGDITDEKQLRRYNNWFSDRDRRLATKKFRKAGKISSSEMMRSFKSYVSKPKSKWSANEKAQWIEYQNYILDQVEETRRPDDINQWTDKWFAPGSDEKNAWYSDDPDTLGQAIVAGRAEGFLLDVPEDKMNSVMSIMGGLKIPKAEAREKSKFYTDTYLPSVAYLNAHDMAINDKTIAAVSALKMNGYVVNDETIKKMMDRIK